jgi:hypothetical protein
MQEVVVMVRFLVVSETGTSAFDPKVVPVRRRVHIFTLVPVDVT